MEGSVNIILIEENFLAGMNHPEIPDVGPMTHLCGSVEGRRTLDRVLFAHAVVEGARVASIGDVGRRVDDDTTLVLPLEEADGREKETIDEAIDPSG